MNNILDSTLIALKDRGIVPEVVEGKHIKVRWAVNGGETRTLVVPRSASDFRAARNSKAELARLLKLDGILDEETEESNELLPATPHLWLEGGIVVTNSLDVATNFGKSHKDVLRTIDRIKGEVDQSFAERNFAPSTYRDASGKENRCVNLTRDGLSLVAMSFTGSAAMAWKVTYIKAFNQMEQELMTLAVPESLTQKIAALEADLAAMFDLISESQKQIAAPAPRQRILPLMRWQKRAAQRRFGRRAA